MAFATATFAGDGAETQWSINFSGGYISEDHVKATLISPTGVESEQEFTFVSPTLLQVTPAVPVGWFIKFYRDTPKEEPLVNFTDGAIVGEANLDKSAQQAIFAVAEMVDQFVEVDLLVATAAEDAAFSASEAEAAQVAAAASAASANAAEGAAAASASEAAASALEAATIAVHAAIVGNPHGTTADDLGLGAVDNTADADKPVSTAQAAAIQAVSGTLAERTVYVEDFGAIADGVADDSGALQAAVTSGYKRIRVPAGTYAIASTVFVPVGVQLICDPRTTIFIPKAGGTLTDGFLFMWNTLDGTTWTTSFPNMNSGGITGAHFQNPANIANARGIKAFCSLHVEGARFLNYTQAIAKPTGLYIDSFHVSDVICEGVQGNTEYQVELLGLGEGLYIKGLHCPSTGLGNSTLACRVRGCAGGNILASIGGSYLFEQCDAVTFTGFHLERSQVIVDSSNMKLSGYLAPDVQIPLITRGTFSDAGGSSRFLVDLDNVQFTFVEGLMEWTGFDVQAAPDVQLSIRNCYRKWTANGDLARSQLSGISLCQADGTTPVTSFNNLSYLLSLESFVGASYTPEVNHLLRTVDVSFDGITATALATVGGNATQWKVATGTYFYRAQLIYDPVRLVGRNQTSAETSVTVVDTTQMVRNTISFSTKPRRGTLRLYRGTTTNSYTEFADIPVLGSVFFFDNGEEVNGVAWQSRAAGAVATINSFGGQVNFQGGNLTLTAGAAPSVGAWSAGDKIDRTGATVDGNNMFLFGLYRLTNGSGHVSGTDWINLRASTVSPAV